MKSAVSMNKPVSIIMALVLALGALVLSGGMGAAQVEPLAIITVEVDPAPTDYVVNDGTMTQQMRWTIDFQSTPDYYTFVIKTYPALVDVAGTALNVDISAEGTPVHNPEWAGWHDWAVPLGQTAGSYIARVEYFSDQGFELGGESVFYVRDKAHLTTVIDLPADGSTHNVSSNFTVSATITNTGDSPATDVWALLDTGATVGLVSGANPQSLGTIAADSGTGQATWTVHCDSVGDSVITVTPSGTDGTSGEPILQENIEGDSITVHQEQQVGDLTVFKFNDLDGDGLYEPGEGETPLDGWEFNIAGVGVRTTSGGGFIVEPGLIPGSYQVTETVKPGWRVTTPNPQTANVPPQGSDTLDFGNQELGSLEVFKFEDLDQDGIYEPGEGETPLDGWQFNIAGVGVRTTSGGGFIVEPDLVPGDYLVTESVKSGWTCTTDNPQTANVPNGGIADTLEFGNYERPEMVPSLSQWGIIAMIVVFGGLLVWTVRRRLASRTG